MRKINGIKSLMVYLRSVDYPLQEEEIIILLEKKQIPHLRPMKDLIVFNLDHIDWWISERRGK